MTQTLKTLKAKLLKTQSLEKETNKIIEEFNYCYNLEDVIDTIQDEINNHPSIHKDRKIKKCLLKEVFKKVYVKGAEKIAVLSIPANAQRNQDEDDDYKCRASEAKVLRIEHLDGKKMVLKKGVVAKSGYDPKFAYKVGTTVRPKEEFDTGSYACASGIHFFMRREDAVNY